MIILKYENENTEFKESLNEKLQKEVVAFLNNNGGNIYIGINDERKIIGIKDNEIDKIQLEIKDRIKNNIKPFTLNLFKIETLKLNNKNIILIKIEKGLEKPYYIRKKGMTTDDVLLEWVVLLKVQMMQQLSKCLQIELNILY